jgi:hypothetical protein
VGKNSIKGGGGCTGNSGPEKRVSCLLLTARSALDCSVHVYTGRGWVPEPYLLEDLGKMEDRLAGLLQQVGHGGLVPHGHLILAHVQGKA